MKTRIEDVPKLRTEQTSIDAPRYNQVRLALMRLNGQIRLPLPGLRGMDLILDRQSWVCVDRTLYDLPILAWTDFGPRQGLHTSVDCLRHFYHINADLISETVLSTMTTLLGERLSENGPLVNQGILPWDHGRRVSA